MSREKKPPQSAFKRLFSEFAYPYKSKIIFGIICTSLSTLFDLLPDVLIGLAVDVVVKQNNSMLALWGITDVRYQLMFLGGLAFLIWSLEAIFEYLYVYTWRTLAQAIQHDMRTKTYAHVQYLNMAYYEEESFGSLLSILNDDINQLERFLDVGIYKCIYLLTTVVAIGAIFFYVAPMVALFVLIPIPLIITFVFYFKKKLAPRYAQVRQRVAVLANRIATTIMGIATIKSYTGEEHELARLRYESNRYKQANHEAIMLSAAFTPVMRMLIVIAFISTVMVGGWYVLQGLLDVGAYSVLVFQTQRLLWPVTELAEMADLYERALASLKRIFGLLDTPAEADKEQDQKLAHNIQGAIKFHDVAFTYPQGTPVFQNLSLRIPVGATVAFVGPTGSGKSTLIKLLLRFYDPTKGSITLDAIDIQAMNTHDLRRSIGLVSQDIFLFHGTIKENIEYGSFDASYDEIVAAAKKAQIHDFILSLPQGYETMIGDRGHKLSGGQRQRLSIARAMLKKSPIFIFDEATSSVDNETELMIRHAIEQLAGKHTIIIIAHRLSTLYKADTIFVLGNGSIVESGNHATLLAQKGVYYALWRMQMEGMYEHELLPTMQAPKFPPKNL